MAVALLETGDLQFAYGPHHWAIDGLRLRIFAGERIALVGANGAGKSTLLHICVGLHAPCGGELRLRGEPVPRNAAGSRRLRESVGLVLQDPNDQLFADTVEADVMFGPLNAGLTSAAAEQRAASVLRAMHLDSIRERRISTLSLGEKKRVAIAGILAMEPAVLLLDEPTAGLDHGGALALIDCLEVLRNTGVAIVIATHNTDLALEWADRILILESGRTIAEGAPQEILQDEALCERARLRQPSLYRIARELRDRLALPPPDAPVTTAVDLADWLEASLAPKQEVLR
ncbi:MAG: ABC transporter ATP-binding protein [Bryobacterales bacterium]|nr:ABC transporter ATP-binding protein [Bryobacterales bacterium]